jgi:two-component system NtrC family sensor kinase
MKTDAAGGSPTASGELADHSRRARRILVVDDESDVLKLLTDLLQIEGFAVDTAKSGADALSRLEQAEYDALLVDLRMPLVTGVELLDEIARRDPALSRRAIFMTGDQFFGERVALVTRPGVPLVTKPFRAEDLVQALRAVLDR